MDLHTDPWDLILARRFKEALALYDSRRSTWQPKDWRQYGGRATVLACLRRYDEAAAELQIAQDTSQSGGAVSQRPFSAKLGGTLWLAGRRAEAVAEWEAFADGLLDKSITYADASGGTGNAMMLRFAALEQNDGRLLEKCDKLFKLLIKSSNIQSWPGPLAFYALEKKSMREVLQESFGATDMNQLLQKKEEDYLIRRRLCQALLHWSVDEHRGNNIAHAAELLRACFSCENYLETEWFLSREMIAEYNN
jgi:hypothetical protein